MTILDSKIQALKYFPSHMALLFSYIDHMKRELNAWIQMNLTIYIYIQAELYRPEVLSLIPLLILHSTKSSVDDKENPRGESKKSKKMSVPWNFFFLSIYNGNLDYGHF